MDEATIANHEKRITAIENFIDEATRGGKPAPLGEARHVAHKHLDEGDLDKAGASLNLGRAHGGEEDDESYARRIKAHLGVEASDVPIPNDGAGDSGDGGGKSEPGTKEPAED